MACRGMGLQVSACAKASSNCLVWSAMRAVVKSACKGEDSMKNSVAKEVRTQTRRSKQSIMKWPKINKEF